MICFGNKIKCGGGGYSRYCNHDAPKQELQFKVKRKGLTRSSDQELSYSDDDQKIRFFYFFSWFQLLKRSF